MTPLVSINLCCYNGARHLRETLDSIIAQTFKDWELVFINDGSTDATGSIIEDYIRRGHPIIYRSRENRGLGYSRNEAIRCSQGQYLAFVDADDLWMPEKLEKQIFQSSLADVWEKTVQYWNDREPEQLAKAEKNPKKKMELTFCWYLGLASHWANAGEKGREMDYQIWCGPAMGAFNDWVRGSYLEDPANRSVIDVAKHILTGAAYLFRLQQLKAQQVTLPTSCNHYQPQPF